MGANRATVPEWHESESITTFTPAGRALNSSNSSSSVIGPFRFTSCGQRHSSVPSGSSPSSSGTKEPWPENWTTATSPDRDRARRSRMALRMPAPVALRSRRMTTSKPRFRRVAAQSDASLTHPARSLSVRG